MAAISPIQGLTPVPMQTSAKPAAASKPATQGFAALMHGSQPVHKAHRHGHGGGHKAAENDTASQTNSVTTNPASPLTTNPATANFFA